MSAQIIVNKSLKKKGELTTCFCNAGELAISCSFFSLAICLSLLPLKLLDCRCHSLIGMHEITASVEKSRRKFTETLCGLGHRSADLRLAPKLPI